MTAPRISLVLGHGGPGRTLLLTELGRAFGADWLAASLSRGAVAARRGGSVPAFEVGSSSRIRGAAYLLPLSVRGEPSAIAVELGESEAAYWGLDDFEPYRALADLHPTPLPGPKPDAARPWVLVDAGSEADVNRALRERGLLGAQIHLLLPAAARLGLGSRDAVRWLDRPAVAAALLGRADLVITRDGPLAWDAMRVGRQVVCLDSNRPASAARLATTLPPALVTDRSFVQGLLQAEPERVTAMLHDIPARTHALELRLAAGELHNPEVERAKRRWQKLRQEPLRFLADSRYPALRKAGSTLQAGHRWVNARRNR